MKPTASLPEASPDQSAASCEYNLTDFGSAEAWQRLMVDLELAQDGRSSTGYLWRGPNLLVETASNPITGLQATNHHGAPEFGYASYMQANGTPDDVRRFMVAVEMHAFTVKGMFPTKVTGLPWNLG